jgi:hypothetical protein
MRAVQKVDFPAPAGPYSVSACGHTCEGRGDAAHHDQSPEFAHGCRGGLRRVTFGGRYRVQARRGDFCFFLPRARRSTAAVTRTWLPTSTPLCPLAALVVHVFSATAKPRRDHKNPLPLASSVPSPTQHYIFTHTVASPTLVFRYTTPIRNHERHPHQRHQWPRRQQGMSRHGLPPTQPLHERL